MDEVDMLEEDQGERKDQPFSFCVFRQEECVSPQKSGESTELKN